MKVYYQAESVAGKIRQNNQDNFYANGYLKSKDDAEATFSGLSEEACQLFAVCDGMGGEEDGETAAFLALDHLRHYDKEDFKNNWKDYIERANQIICQYQDEHNIRMGTTFAGVSVSLSGVLAVNVGDSRIYRIRKNRIWQISRDHNQYQAMTEAGIKADKETMKRAKNRLTQCLGISEERVRLQPHVVYAGPAESGDVYLICSDGLYGALSEQQIIRSVSKVTEGKEGVAEELVKSAEKYGSRDNITAVVAYIMEMESSLTIKQRILRKFFGKKY